MSRITTILTTRIRLGYRKLAIIGSMTKTSTSVAIRNITHLDNLKQETPKNKDKKKQIKNKRGPSQTSSYSV